MDIDDPVYRNSHGVDWWWDGKVWSYWEFDSEWVIAPEASPVSLVEVKDDVPIGARPAPPGFVRGTNGRLYPR